MASAQPAYGYRLRTVPIFGPGMYTAILRGVVGALHALGISLYYSSWMKVPLRINPT